MQRETEAKEHNQLETDRDAWRAEARSTGPTGAPADGRHAPTDPRARLLAGVPVTDRRLEVAGVSTAVLEGGEGPPVVLLHGPGEFAARWMRVIPRLVTTHRVIAPDLPDHGSSEVMTGRLDGDLVLAWLGKLIERTCPTPPVLVGHLLGGSIAARFAVDEGHRLSQLVLVDTFGLSWFRPSPRFTFALVRTIARPTVRSYEHFMQYCAADRDRLRKQMGDRWELVRTYGLDLYRTPRVRSAMRTLMLQLGAPPIPQGDLARIEVPTTLVWGRQDLATRLRVAEAASDRYGWPLHVIDGAADDPPMERPEAFLDVLYQVLGQGRNA